MIKATSDHESGRLDPVERLVEAARAGAGNLASLLEEFWPALKLTPADYIRPFDQAAFSSFPAGLGGGALDGVTVWHEVALFAVRSDDDAPVLSIDDGESLPMSPVEGTPYWIRLETIAPGRLHRFRFGVGGEWAPGSDFAGYHRESYEQPGVTRGTLSDQRSVASAIYPGASTNYRLYVNHGVDEVRGAPVMVWNDGHYCLPPVDMSATMGLRIQVVTDNLVHAGLIPPMVHLLVPPSTNGDEVAHFPEATRYHAMRRLQYSTIDDRYGRHLVEEVFPDAAAMVKLRSDAYSRGSAGISGGGVCTFKLAWCSPDEFSRVHATMGSFRHFGVDVDTTSEIGVNIAHLVCSQPRRNIRVWTSSGVNDGLAYQPSAVINNMILGSLAANNIDLANALKANDYDFHFRFGEGTHSLAQAAVDLPESLAWLWRDYDPDRTEQQFTQEASERDKPPFRVGIVNREAW